MAYFSTATAPERRNVIGKNRVWDFFSLSNETHPANRRQPAQPRRKICPTAMKTASGIPYWPSRDPIGERGGMNLYGFVWNDGVDEIDALGMIKNVQNDQGKEEYEDYLNMSGSVVPREIDSKLSSSASTFEFTNYCELKKHVIVRQMTVENFKKTQNGRKFGNGPTDLFDSKSPGVMLAKLENFYRDQQPCMCNLAARASMYTAMLQSAANSRKNMNRTPIAAIIRLESRKVRLDHYGQIVETDLIPGDWGYIYKIPKDYSETLDAKLRKTGEDLLGTEGENIIYLGGQQWGGWNGKGQIQPMTLYDWQNRVIGFSVLRGGTDNDQAPVRDSLYFPMTGIRHFQPGL